MASVLASRQRSFPPEPARASLSWKGDAMRSLEAAFGRGFRVGRAAARGGARDAMAIFKDTPLL
ncbi:hypothetical protein LCGC14_1675540 [marine sediment metagenome]|uniref:Uncharacterized protein n=1 Tax=marine sediment metagenome TaxID=412755 RepID=A0A0F9KPY9_9ZZZZ